MRRKIGSVEQTLFIDVTTENLSFKMLSDVQNIDQHLFLKSEKDKHSELLQASGDTLTALECLLSSIRGEESKTTIVLGNYSDPLSLKTSDISLALSAIEKILSVNPRKFVIQTRSPLILLAVPMLNSKKNTIEINYAIEYLENKNLSRFIALSTPNLENIVAANTLEKLGFDITILFSPIVFKSQLVTDIFSRLTTFISQAQAKIRVLDFAKVWKGRENFIHLLDPAAHIKLSNNLSSMREAA